MISICEKDYCFAIGRKIKRVFTESELYRDGKYDERYPFTNLSLRMIDKPLFLLLDNNMLLRLYGTSLSVANGYDVRYVLGKKFKKNAKTQKEFKRLCGLTIVNVQEFHANQYDYSADGTVEKVLPDEFGNGCGLTDLAIVFDNGLRFVCYMYLDFFEIEIVESK